MKSFIKKIISRFVHFIYPYFEQVDLERSFGNAIALQRVGNGFTFGIGNQVIGPQNMIFGEKCHVGRMCRFETISKYGNQTFSPSLIVSDNVSFEDFCHIGCAEKIEIGSGTMIASRVFVTDHFHGSVTKEDLEYGRPAARPLSTKPVKIGRDVWIGEGVSIMPGVSLGDNVIVGANAVVTHSFGPNVVIGGCPAKIIKNWTNEVEDSYNDMSEDKL